MGMGDITYLVPYIDGVLRVKSLIRLAKSARDGGLSKLELMCPIQLIFVTSKYYGVNLCLGICSASSHTVVYTIQHFISSVFEA